MAVCFYAKEEGRAAMVATEAQLVAGAVLWVEQEAGRPAVVWAAGAVLMAAWAAWAAVAREEGMTRMRARTSAAADSR
jgi:hypothetical protein